ncbi:MAG: PulJ/GspJ family protein [Desulfomonilia bacterium]
MRRILSRSSHRDSGFTLIELLMAIAIAAIVMTVVNLAFFQAHRAIESVGSQRETYQMVRVVMDRMMKDLSCAYVPATEGTGRTLGEEDISLYRFVGKTTPTEMSTSTAFISPLRQNWVCPGSWAAWLRWAISSKRWRISRAATS